MNNNQNLKNKVLNGGIYLAMRQIIGAVASLISILVVARILGPKNYGVVAVASGVLYFTFWTGKLGLEIYLIRQPDLSKDAPEQILAFFNTVGIGLCCLLWLIASIYGFLTQQVEVAHVLQCLVPVVWVEMVSNVSISMMERELRFAQVGLIETIAQLANSVLTVSLVLLNFGYWGPIAGIIFQYILLGGMARYCYQVPWHWQWRWSFIRPALLYGLSYSASNSIASLKTLTLSLFVSPIAGLEAAGIISVAIRFVDQLGMFRIIVARMAISALSKLINDTDAIRRAISKGSVYQLMLICPVFAIFSSCSAWIIPLVFGQEWLLSARIFPFIAFAGMCYTCFALHFTALYTAGHNSEVGKYNILHVSLFWITCWLLLPTLGLWGFIVAELFVLLSYFLIHLSLVKLCGSPNYTDAFWLILSTTPALFAGPYLPTIAGLGILVASYGLLVLFRPTIRTIPTELYSVWRMRKASAFS